MLAFFEEDDVLHAKISVSGYVPELESIYKFAEDFFQPYRDNRILITLLKVEFVLIMFLIARVIIEKSRKRKGSTDLDEKAYNRHGKNNQQS